MATELRRLERREEPEEMPEPEIEETVFRRGNQIVIDFVREAELPNRCMCCGSESEDNEPVTTDLSWISPAYIVLAFIAWPLLIIAFFLARKQLKLTWWLCPAHLASRRRTRIATIAFFVSSVPLCIAAGAYENGALGIIGGLLFLAFVVAAIMLSRYSVRIANLRKDQFFINGARKPFLETLPKVDKDGRVSW